MDDQFRGSKRFLLPQYPTDEELIKRADMCMNLLQRATTQSPQVVQQVAEGVCGQIALFIERVTAVELQPLRRMLDIRLKQLTPPAPTLPGPASPVSSPPPPPMPVASPPRAARPAAGGPWPCATCTFINPPHAEVCDLCGTPRPGAAVDRWECVACHYRNPADSRACRNCGRPHE
ncbi:hypothetical protein PAPYR_1222 [Paratrimastix pyriformis]|uniref:RanBP2-type domain-containing protein n=1 Tax=Paratrimastix pyriformis TaxID=342808 RepID=A0ABQ8USE5_9EUKA|nr:hypothetical protein PAPYR_1222 [Paratrimastix pyriformis]